MVDHRHSRRGFTMIELIVTLVVLLIVSALAIGTYTTTLDKADSSRAATTILTFAKEQRSLAGARDDIQFTTRSLERGKRYAPPGLTIDSNPAAAATDDSTLALALSAHGSKLGLAARSRDRCVLGLSTLEPPSDITWERLGLPGNACSAALALAGSAYTGSLAAPAAPTSVAAVPTATFTTITWKHPETGSGLDGFRIYRDGTQVGQTAATALEFRDPVSPGSYIYVVRAYNTAGESADGTP